MLRGEVDKTEIVLPANGLVVLSVNVPAKSKLAPAGTQPESNCGGKNCIVVEVARLTVSYVPIAESDILYVVSPPKCAWYVHPVFIVFGEVPVTVTLPLSSVVPDSEVG